MKRAAAIIVAAGLAYAAPAQADVRLQIEPANGQTSRFEDGRRMTDNVGQAATVRFVQPKVALSKRGGFMIIAANSGENAFHIGPENVTAHLADGTPVPIVGYDRLVKEANRGSFWRNMAVALTAPSAPSTETSGTVSYGGSTFGSVGTIPYSGRTSGTVTYTEHDPLKAAAAQAIVASENRQRMEAMQLRQQSLLAAIETEVLQTTTIDPGNTAGGMLYFDIPQQVRRAKAAVPVTFTVEAGGEKHVFSGKFDPAK